MITIKVRNVKSQLSNYTLGLEEKLSCWWPKYWHSTKYKDGLWDGQTHFLDIMTGKFPTGLLHIVEGYFREEGTDFQIVDERGYDRDLIDSGRIWSVHKDLLHGITLRQDQLDAIIDAVNNFRGVIHMPTGTGKTEVAIGITKALNLPTLIMVNSKSLMWQTHDRFIVRLNSNIYEIGVFGDSLFAPGTRVTIATVQSLDQMKKQSTKRFGDFMKTFQVIMFDECHHASAKTWYTAGMWAHNAFYRFGFSGTPMDREELDSMKLMAVVGQTIYKRKTEDAIEDGDLCPIIMDILDNDETVYGARWQEIYREGIVDSKQRNQMIVNTATGHYEKGDKVLILVRQIDHGGILRRMLEGWPVRFVHGSNSMDQRDDSVQWFLEGKGILIASGIFDEGIDIPEINVLITASGGKSDVKTIQRIGRGLRKKKDGGVLKAYDFLDNSKYLKQHSERRIEVYIREGYLDA